MAMHHSISTLFHQPGQLYCNAPEKFSPNSYSIEWNNLPNITIEEQSPDSFFNNITINQ